MEKDEDVYEEMSRSLPEKGDQLIRFTEPSKGVHVNSGQFPEDREKLPSQQARVHLRELLNAEGFRRAADQIVDSFIYIPGNDCLLQPIFSSIATT